MGETRAIAALSMMLGLLIVPVRGWADDWPGALPFHVFSKSAKYFVRVIPGESIGDTVGLVATHRG
jgi:hypothetical protein